MPRTHSYAANRGLPISTEVKATAARPIPTATRPMQITYKAMWVVPIMMLDLFAMPFLAGIAGKLSRKFPDTICEGGIEFHNKLGLYRFPKHAPGLGCCGC
jgi:hypothetical protein